MKHSTEFVFTVLVSYFNQYHSFHVSEVHSQVTSRRLMVWKLSRYVRGSTASEAPALLPGEASLAVASEVTVTGTIHLQLQVLQLQARVLQRVRGALHSVERVVMVPDLLAQEHYLFFSLA